MLSHSLTLFAGENILSFVGLVFNAEGGRLWGGHLWNFIIATRRFTSYIVWKNISEAVFHDVLSLMWPC